MNLILQWIDLIWLPLALLAVHEHQRGWTLAFCLSCMVMMRLQVELILSTGFTSGFTGLFTMGVHSRAQVTYSVFYVIYIALAVYSPKTQGAIFMAATISMFFAALCTSMIVMAL